MSLATLAPELFHKIIEDLCLVDLDVATILNRALPPHQHSLTSLSQTSRALRNRSLPYLYATATRAGFTSPLQVTLPTTTFPVYHICHVRIYLPPAMDTSWCQNGPALLQLFDAYTEILTLTIDGTSAYRFFPLNGRVRKSVSRQSIRSRDSAELYPVMMCGQNTTSAAVAIEEDNPVADNIWDMQFGTRGFMHQIPMPSYFEVQGAEYSGWLATALIRRISHVYILRLTLKDSVKPWLPLFSGAAITILELKLSNEDPCPEFCLRVARMAATLKRIIIEAVSVCEDILPYRPWPSGQLEALRLDIARVCEGGDVNVLSDRVARIGRASTMMSNGYDFQLTVAGVRRVYT